MNEINLNAAQWKALGELNEDAGKWIEASTKSKLRKLGLIGKVVTHDDGGRQKTLSPLTDSGRALLSERPKDES